MKIQNTVDIIQNQLYRFCVCEEILFFVKNNYLKSNNHKYLSFTKNAKIFPVLGNPETSSNYFVTYDKEKIFKQGGIEIQYNVDWLIKNINIFNHINTSAELTFQDYCDFESYLLPNLSKKEKLKIYIEDNLSGIKSENEIILKKLIFEPKLILDIKRLDSRFIETELVENLINKINKNDNSRIIN